MIPWLANEEEVKAYVGKGTLFHQLMETLIRWQGIKSGIPSSCIATTEENKRDGGVDIEIEPHAPCSTNDWFVCPESIYQFKAEHPGDNFSTYVKKNKTRLEKDIDDKKYVHELLTRGYKNYVFCSAYTFTAEQLDELEKGLKESLKSKGFPSVEVHVLNANKIASWAACFPDICSKFFKKPIGSLQLFEFAYKTIDTGIPFVPDQQRQEIIDYVQELSQQQNVKIHIRIEGTTGVGKTRVTFESIKRTSRANAFFYAGDPSQIPSDLFPEMQLCQIKGEFLLIVDECEKAEANKIKTQLDISNFSYLLITINRKADTRYAETVYDLQQDGRTYLTPLGEDKVESIVKSILSEPADWIKKIVRLSSGFVKIAVALADEARKYPESPNVLAFMEHPAPKEALEVLVADEQERNLLRYLGLFTKLGWEDGLENERQAVFKWTRLTEEQKFLDIVEKTRKRGLVVKTGRYRYVTPDLFAIWLAAELYDTRTNSDFVELLKGLPTSGSKDAFVERLADLGDLEESQKTVNELLKEFKNLKDINGDFSAGILATLTEADPEEGKKKIRDIILSASREDLEKFTLGRAEIIWALKKLAWFSDAFDDSLDILFKLAQTEKDKRNDYATDAIKTLYQTHLSGTEVPLLERLSKLERYYKSSDPTIKLLSLHAYHSVLEVWQTRDGSSEKQRSRKVPQEYRTPPDEVKKAALRVLEVFYESSSDTDVEVKKIAKKYLINAGRVYALYGIFDEYLNYIKKLYEQDKSLIRDIRDVLQSVLSYEKASLTEKQKKSITDFIDQTTNSDFSLKLQRWLGRLTHEDYSLELKQPAEILKIRSELASTLLSDQELLLENIDWLLSEEASSVWQVAFYLGENDKEGTILRILGEKIKDGKQAIFYPAYIAGWSKRNEPEARAYITKELERKIVSPIILFDCLWRNDFFGKEWIVSSAIELVKNNALEAWRLQAFRWTGWINSIDKELYMRLLTTVMVDTNAKQETASTVTLLNTRLRTNKSEEDVVFFAKTAEALLTRESAILADMQMDEWEWNELAEIYLDYFPVELVKSILKAFCSRKKNLFEHDYPLQLLHTVVVKHPKECWPLVGECLLKGDECAAIMAISFGDWFAGGIDQDILMLWAQEHEKESGPSIVAQLTKLMSGGFKDSLARKLLVTYPEDKEIKGILFGSFFSGGFSGPMSDHTKQQIKQAEEIKKDEDINIKRFADDLITYLKKQLEQDKNRDEEWGLK